MKNHILLPCLLITAYLLAAVSVFLPETADAQLRQFPSGLKARYALKMEGFYLDEFAARGEDRPKEQDLLTEGRVKAAYDISATSQAYLDGRLILRRRDRQFGVGGSDTDVLLDAEVRELWYQQKELFASPAFIKVGRSRLKEPRGWWWDEPFESVRAGYDTTQLDAEIGIGERLTQTRISEDSRLKLEKDITWLFGTASYQWRYQSFFQARFLYQQDDNQSRKTGDILNSDDPRTQDSDLVWLGIRSTGNAQLFTLPGRISYWADLAYVNGDEENLQTVAINSENHRVTAVRNQGISGWGMDVGVTVFPDMLGKAAITLAYAYGSEEYRQPKLHRNRSRFAGYNDFRIYGEVLRPNLSNLHIVTAAVGFPVGPVSWLETVYHYYRQSDAQALITDSRITLDPDGRDRDIGHALDMVIGSNLKHGISYNLAGGLLLPGSAFATSDDLAYRIQFKLRYDF